MTRTAILDGATRRATEARLGTLRETLQKVETLQADLQASERLTAEQAQALAQVLLPIAAAMSRLTDEARATMQQLQERATAATTAAEKAAAAAAASSTQADKVRRAIESATGRLVEAAKARPVSWAPWLAALLPLMGILWLAHRVGAL